MTLQRHEPQDLKRFLTAIDAELEAPASIVVIGGAALGLGYGVSAATNDVDTFESELATIQVAAARARAGTGLDIPIANSRIAQLPAGYETRLLRVLPELGRLEVWVVDPHDLAASKLLRGNDHDRHQLAVLHQMVGLDLQTLVTRFRELIADFVGDPTEPRWSLYHFVDEVWGEIAALDVRPA